MSKKRTIKWVCTAKPNWEWLSWSPGQPSFPVGSDPIREGTITLPPNRDFWYPCVELVAQGLTTGNTYLRYFSEDGIDKVQAIAVAQNCWISEGEISNTSSETKGDGGFTLKVYF